MSEMEEHPNQNHIGALTTLCAKICVYENKVSTHEVLQILIAFQKQ